MSERLERQIERILNDEGSGDRHRVIVQMTAPDEMIDQTRSPFLRTVAQGMERRNLTLTARDLLPDRSRKEHRPRSGKGARPRPTTDMSLASQFSAADLPSVNRKELMNISQNVLWPLLSSPIAERSRAESIENYGKEGEKLVRGFWTSQSAVLDLTTEDLKRLPATVPEIRSIFPSRPLKAPRLIEVKNLSQAVQESRASAWGIEKIGALAVWGAYGARGKGVKVGLLDTGVDLRHPDLKGKISAWAEFDLEGHQVVGSKPHDSAQHGTHCAGIIVGGRSGGPWIGVAPEATLIVGQVLSGEQGGTLPQLLAGVDWLIGQGVDVINMSLGSLYFDQEAPDLYTEAILSCLRLGVPVVISIGNEGGQTTSSPGNDYFAFSVGAVDFADRAAGFSGGRTHLIHHSRHIPKDNLPLAYSTPDVTAPGVAILSSVPGAAWASCNGTSMAAPHVTGAIALLLSATCIREAIPEHERAFVIQDLLTGSVEEVGESGQDHRFGFGRIDVLRAIGFARELGYA